jgi:hypothetical protein
MWLSGGWPLKVELTGCVVKSKRHPISHRRIIRSVEVRDPNTDKMFWCSPYDLLDNQQRVLDNAPEYVTNLVQKEMYEFKANRRRQANPRKIRSKRGSK